MKSKRTAPLGTDIGEVSADERAKIEQVYREKMEECSSKPPERAPQWLIAARMNLVRVVSE